MAPTKRPTPYTPEQKEAAEAIGQKLVEALREEFFALEGTPKLPVKYEDGHYGVKPLVAGWEYALVNVFVGARGYPVFQFEPEDAQEYKLVDFTIKDLDNYLPIFGPHMAAVLGYDDIEAAPAVMARAVAEYREKNETAKKQAAAEEQAAFSALPGFGRFG